MARASTNWLSFSLSPMDMLRTPEPQFVQYDAASDTSSHHYYLDNLYTNGWGNGSLKFEQNLNHSDVSFVQSSSSLMTHIYDHHHHHHHHGSSAYFGGDHQDLKAITGFQAFSTNSGSEVDDSASIGKAQGSEFGTHSIESSVNEFAAFSGGTNTGGTLSLAVAQSSEKAVAAAAESDRSKKVVDTFGQRTSIYRGVTRHRWTGRYEAHLWDNSCRREGQARKGRQVYLGGYDKEEKAARSYDLAALKYWGPTATTNFPVSNYSKEVEEMKHVTKQEFIASLRRKSSGFSRGASIYRGVTRHHQQGRWQARIGRVAGNKDLYLGTFATEEEAAEAYDIAAIKFRGANAVTNFEMNRYDVEAIMKSSLPVGGAAKRLRLSLESEQKALPVSSSSSSSQQQNPHQQQNPQCGNVSASINFSSIHQPIASIPCGIPFDSTTAYYHHNLFQHFHPTNAGTAASAVTSANANALTALPPTAAAEFFIWPHQSY
ncbi:AP2-like ethylene-responsive transcription factor AIL6 [Glycine soja]|nr:AP2-like ethylene-responsive transcription factor AIL6 [Glycine soja]